MNPNTPEQLARLLDQISAMYPNGIPREALRRVPEREGGVEEVAGADFHIFIVGSDAATSEASKDLLAAITSKGLKIGDADYTTSYTTDEAAQAAASGSASRKVIVFGASRENGWVERPHGNPVLFTSSLEALLSDATLKKALWRDLQTLI